MADFKTRGVLSPISPDGVAFASERKTRTKTYGRRKLWENASKKNAEDSTKNVILLTGIIIILDKKRGNVRGKCNTAPVVARTFRGIGPPAG